MLRIRFGLELKQAFKEWNLKNVDAYQDLQLNPPESGFISYYNSSSFSVFPQQSLTCFSQNLRFFLELATYKNGKNSFNLNTLLMNKISILTQLQFAAMTA